MKRFLLLLVVLSLVPLFQLTSSAEAEELPPATWYAVVYNSDADQLFWINAQGSQAVMSRPHLPNEKPNVPIRIEFSRDGRSMVIIAEQNNGQIGLGFFDLETNQFNIVHSAAPDEFVGEGILLSSPTSDRIVFPLQNMGTGAWRLIEFTLPDGNAINQLTSTDVDAPQVQSGIVFVTLYDIDQGTNQHTVHFQFQSNVSEYNEAYMWTTEGPNEGVGFSPYSQYDMDIKWPDGQAVFGVVDPQQAFVQTDEPFVIPVNTLATKIGDGAAQLAHFDGAHILRFPTWANNGDWLAFKVTADQALADHWEIKDLTGASQPDVVALGPNFNWVYGTPDGYLAIDNSAGKIYHNDTFAIEAFSTQVGNSVLTFPPQQNVSVVYVTPMNTAFNLGFVGDGQPIVDGPNDIQSNECNGIMPTRLSQGSDARVTFTDGSPLNIRDAANGNKIGEAPEGTQMTIISEGICVEGFRWYQVQLTSEISAWAAEVGSDEYFLEPTLNIQAATVAPTTLPPGEVNSNATPLSRGINCQNSVPNYLAIGDNAVVIVDVDATLAVYPEATAEIPTRQLARRTQVEIIGGPECSNNGARRWEVRFAQNGRSFTGWVADGFGQVVYLTLDE